MAAVDPPPPSPLPTRPLCWHPFLTHYLHCSAPTNPAHILLPRYDGITGELQPVLLHSVPAAVLTGAEAEVQAGRRRPPAPGTPSYIGAGGGDGSGTSTPLPRPWIGFNVEDAATHIKLEEGAGGPASAVFGAGGLLPGGGGGGGGGGKVGRGRKSPSSKTIKVAKAGAGYDPAAWAPQGSAAATLPSLVRR